MWPNSLVESLDPPKILILDMADYLLVVQSETLHSVLTMGRVDETCIKFWWRSKDSTGIKQYNVQRRRSNVLTCILQCF